MLDASSGPSAFVPDSTTPWGQVHNGYRPRHTASSVRPMCVASAP